MASYCVLVKGPCRGTLCDYWGRVKIRKFSIDELAEGIRSVIVRCQSNNEMTLEEALHEYWRVLGIRDMKRLCEEEPDLYAKMIKAEIQAQI